MPYIIDCQKYTFWQPIMVGYCNREVSIVYFQILTKIFLLDIFYVKKVAYKAKSTQQVPFILTE